MTILGETYSSKDGPLRPSYTSGFEAKWQQKRGVISGIV